MNIQNIWQQPKSPELVAELKQFWKIANGIPSTDLDSVCLIARNEENQIRGVLLTIETYSSRLANTFFAYTVHIHPNHRRSKLATKMLLLANSYFEQQFILGETKNIGALLRIENKALAEHHNEAIWDTTGFIYIGKLPKAGHIRVRYFKGARV